MNQLLQEALIHTKNVHQAFLIRRWDGNIHAAQSSTYTHIPFYQLADSEDGARISKAFESPLDTRESGFQFFRKKYPQCVRCDDLSLYARNAEGDGLVITRTGSYYVVATYLKTMHPSVAVESVERLGDYLREKGK